MRHAAMPLCHCAAMPPVAIPSCAPALRVVALCPLVAQLNPRTIRNGSMTQPRTSTQRSSLAIALNQYYVGPRPGVALTISAVALLAAVAIGIAHVVMLGQSGAAIADGQRAMRTLHRYNAVL